MSNKKFVICRRVLDSRDSLTILVEDARKVISAKQLMVEISIFEELFEQVMRAFVEFENDLNRMALDHMIDEEFSYSHFRGWRLDIDRRVRNLLSAAKFYEDAGNRQAKLLSKHVPGAAAAFRNGLKALRKSSQEYLICCGLRNYSQHQASAVGDMRVGGRWIGDTDSRALLCRLEAYVDIAGILKNSRLDDDIRDVLETISDSIDIRDLLRQYISRVGTLHNDMRRMLTSSVIDAEGAMQAAMHQFQQAFPNEKTLVGLAVVEVDEHGRHKNAESLFEELGGYTRWLTQRHRNVKNLAKFHITSQRAESSSKRKA